MSVPADIQGIFYSRCRWFCFCVNVIMVRFCYTSRACLSVVLQDMPARQMEYMKGRVPIDGLSLTVVLCQCIRPRRVIQSKDLRLCNWLHVCVLSVIFHFCALLGQGTEKVAQHLSEPSCSSPLMTFSRSRGRLRWRPFVVVYNFPRRAHGNMEMTLIYLFELTNRNVDSTNKCLFRLACENTVVRIRALGKNSIFEPFGTYRTLS